MCEREKRRKHKIVLQWCSQIEVSAEERAERAKEMKAKRQEGKELRRHRENEKTKQRDKENSRKKLKFFYRCISLVLIIMWFQVDFNRKEHT